MVCTSISNDNQCDFTRILNDSMFGLYSESHDTVFFVFISDLNDTVFGLYE